MLNRIVAVHECDAIPPEAGLNSSNADGYIIKKIENFVCSRSLYLFIRGLKKKGCIFHSASNPSIAISQNSTK